MTEWDFEEKCLTAEVIKFGAIATFGYAATSSSFPQRAWNKNFPTRKAEIRIDWIKELTMKD